VADALRSAVERFDPALVVASGDLTHRGRPEQYDAAEELLRSLGFRELRVRHHGEVARIEVPLAEVPRLAEPDLRERVVAGLKALGYRYVTVDLEGFRSGSLNPAPGGTPGGGEGETRESGGRA
jgi:uncharacterized protein